jgi:hypothetical protein
MAGKVQVARRERLSRICKHIIDGGPRSVDDDIRAQLKAATLKYAATQYVETEQALKNLYRGEGELGSLVRKAVEIAGEADRDDGGDETDVTKGEHRGHHSLTSALIQHLHDALDRRREAHGYQKSAKEQPTMSSIKSLENIAKAHRHRREGCASRAWRARVREGLRTQSRVGEGHCCYQSVAR